MKASVYNGDSVTYRIKVNDRIADKSRFPWGRSEMFYGGLTEDVIEDYGCFDELIEDFLYDEKGKPINIDNYVYCY